MAQDSILACVAALRQAGWHVAPAANAWQMITEIHADRWLSPQVMDTAVLSIGTGQALAQRVQITIPPDGSELPQHQILAHTGPLPVAELPAVVASWPTNSTASPAPDEATPAPSAAG